MREDQEYRIIEAIDDLAAYASAHEMTVLHRALSAASVLVKGFSESEYKASVRSMDWFEDVLNLLISYARRRDWAEVLDHLLEAKLAWEERDKDGPNGNILTFRGKRED